MTIARNLVTAGEPLCRPEPLADIRIGLGYTYMELQDQAAGIAWTPGQQSGSCTHLKKAGKIEEMTENELLHLLSSDNHLEKAIGLATFNALNTRAKHQYHDREAISDLGIRATDRVMMVGYFAPLIARIKKTGCRFDVIDLKGDKPNIIDLRLGPQALAECDLAIITATSIINDTIDDLLAHLHRNRGAVILGPSTPICPEAFQGTRISQLSGSLVKDRERVKRIISQGGGTMVMKQHLQFVTASIG